MTYCLCLPVNQVTTEVILGYYRAVQGTWGNAQFEIVPALQAVKFPNRQMSLTQMRTWQTRGSKFYDMQGNPKTQSHFQCAKCLLN